MANLADEISTLDEEDNNQAMEDIEEDQELTLLTDIIGID